MSDKKQMRVGEQRGYRPQEVNNIVRRDSDTKEVSGLLKRTRERLGLSSRPVKG